MARTKRIETKYLDKLTHNIDQAINWALEAKANGEAISIAVICNAVELLKRLIERNILIDTLTDQTSAHDELVGYFPMGISVEQAKLLREKIRLNILNAPWIQWQNMLI